MDRGHLHENVDTEKTALETHEPRDNPRLNQELRQQNPDHPIQTERDNDFAQGVVHMISGTNDPDLKNELRGHIRAIQEM